MPLALALATVTGLVLVFTRVPQLHLDLEGPTEMLHHSQSMDLRGTVFVSISSYRDDECAYTIQHMFDMADVPERIFVGVCEQNWRDRESCRTGHMPLKLREHVQYMSVNSSMAKGPTYGRALAQRMFNDEDYYMQIDSHTQFAPGWDRRMIAMYTKLQRCNPKVVLSHYPASSEDLDDKEVPRICNSTFLPDVGVWRLWEAENQLPPGQFVPTPFAAAGFMFYAGHILREVPFDPQLPYLFDGEEILYSARLWTHGYDIFTPVENLIFHHYEREKGKSVYSDHDEVWWDVEQRTLVKVRFMLGLSQQPPNETLADSMRVYGMGKARTLGQYYQFADMDPATNTSHAAAKFCGPENGIPPTACLRQISAPIVQAIDEMLAQYGGSEQDAAQGAEDAAAVTEDQPDQQVAQQGPSGALQELSEAAVASSQHEPSEAAAAVVRRRRWWL